MKLFLKFETANMLKESIDDFILKSSCKNKLQELSQENFNYVSFYISKINKGNENEFI